VRLLVFPGGAAGSSGGGGVGSGLQFYYDGAAPIADDFGLFTRNGASFAAATQVSFSIFENQTNNADTVDVLQRLTTGAIFEVRKSATAWARYRSTGAPVLNQSGTEDCYNISVASEAVGPDAITNGDVIYLSILSDAPSTVVGGTGRVTMTANRIYYVRSTGTRTGYLASETDATTNTDVDAFGSLTAARDAVSKLDCNGFIPEIEIGSGSFSAAFDCKNLVGADKITIRGNGSANTSIGKVTSSVLQFYEFFALKILHTSSSGYTSAVENLGGRMHLGGDCIIDYNNSSAAGARGQFVYVESGGSLTIGSGLTLTGSSSIGFLIQNTSVFKGDSKIINFTSLTLDQSQFVSSQNSVIDLAGATVNGSPGGNLYEKQGGGIIRKPDYTYF
jgi:hypothetical protein